MLSLMSLAVVLGGAVAIQSAADTTVPSTQPATMPIIILKFDDVTRAGTSEHHPVSRRWERLAEYLESRNIHASSGIIGSSLEGDAPAYFEWIRAASKRGDLEFWNHGYKYRTTVEDSPEFKGTSLEEQTAAIGRTQRLAKEKLGIELKAFAPHYSETDATTIQAVRSFPEIKVWFAYWDGPFHMEGFSPLVLERNVPLEEPTHVPNYDAFRKGLAKVEGKRPCVYLQGHPNQWDDARWAEFVKIIEYLKERGCTFMKVSEYYDVATRAAAVGK